METTNSVFNSSLYDQISVQSVPYWSRVIVATRTATTSPEWHDVFYKENSGTYNNQWMTLDYKLFTPRQPLPPNLFWVSEQMPGWYDDPLPLATVRICLSMPVGGCFVPLERGRGCGSPGSVHTKLPSANAN